MTMELECFCMGGRFHKLTVLGNKETIIGQSVRDGCSIFCDLCDIVLA